MQFSEIPSKILRNSFRNSSQGSSNNPLKNSFRDSRSSSNRFFFLEIVVPSEIAYAILSEIPARIPRNPLLIPSVDSQKKLLEISTEISSKVSSRIHSENHAGIPAKMNNFSTDSSNNSFRRIFKEFSLDFFTNINFLRIFSDAYLRVSIRILTYKNGSRNIFRKYSKNFIKRFL